MKKVLIITAFSILTLFHAKGQWKSTNGPIGSTINSLITKGGVLVAGANDGIYVSTSTKDNWIKSNTGLNNQRIRSLSVINNNIFAGTDNSVYVSSNDGSNWSFKGLLDYIVYSFTVKDNIIYAGTNGGVLNTKNNGSSWTASNTGISFPAFGFSLACSGNNIFLGASGSIYVSNNSGTSWSDLNIFFSDVKSIVISGTNVYAGSIYDSTNQGGFYFSSNNGIDWVNKTTGLTSTNVNSIVVNNNNIFIGTDSGVFFSNNNGDTWKDVSLGLTNKKIMTLAILDNVIYAGTKGDGVWGRTLSEIQTSVSDLIVKAEIDLYPNPTSEYFMISTNYNPTDLKLQIHSISGELIKLVTYNNTQKQIDIRELKNGIYFISIVSNEGAITKRLIVNH